jgi:hypothetical protein
MAVGIVAFEPLGERQRLLIPDQTVSTQDARIEFDLKLDVFRHGHTPWIPDSVREIARL